MSDITEFQKELEQLINKHCIENVCDVPDFLLAEMCVNMITGVGPVIKKTLDWHGCDSICHPQTDNKSLNADPKSESGDSSASSVGE